MEESIKEEQNMAHAYTPGLKIKSMETVRKERVLPIEGTILVEVGDEVDFDSTLARTEIPGDAEILNVTEELGVDPGDVFDYSLKKEGETFEEGELLAKNVAFWGLVKNYVYAPFSGTTGSCPTWAPSEESTVGPLGSTVADRSWAQRWIRSAGVTLFCGKTES